MRLVLVEFEPQRHRASREHSEGNADRLDHHGQGARPRPPQAPPRDADAGDAHDGHELRAAASRDDPILSATSDDDSVLSTSDDHPLLSTSDDNSLLPAPDDDHLGEHVVHPPGRGRG
jgi:hypothetical protein